MNYTIDTVSRGANYSHIPVTPRKLGAFSGSLLKEQSMLTNNTFKLHKQPCLWFLSAF